MIVIERKIYQKPQCNIICTETEALLGNASGNAGKIQPGTVTGDAKQNIFSEEDLDNASWNDTEEN
mgnify:CR=1 FL=1